MRLKLMAVDAHSLHTSSVHIDNSLKFDFITPSDMLPLTFSSVLV